jgi:hypothetical protein
MRGFGFAFVLLLSLPIAARAQTGTITGRVTDEDGELAIGARNLFDEIEAPW